MPEVIDFNTKNKTTVESYSEVPYIIVNFPEFSKTLVEYVPSKNKENITFDELFTTLNKAAQTVMEAKYAEEAEEYEVAFTLEGDKSEDEE